MSDSEILFESRDGVACVTLNRPASLNALTSRMFEELFAALDRAERESRCVLLTGAGRGFCSGADLADKTLMDTDDLGAVIDKAFNPLARRLRELKLPLVAAVNGVCAGAGMSLAAAADIVIAARSASFIQAFSRIGLVPDTAATHLLPRAIGRARAAGMMLLGEKIDAETAAGWGLIWKVVDDAALPDEAMAIGRRLANGATKGLILTRRLLNAAETNDFEAQLVLERDYQREAGFSEDYKEGVTAFFEKRPPVYRGR